MARRWILLSIYGGLALLTSEVAWFLFKIYRKRLDFINKKKTITEVLMFSDICKYCRDHASGNPCKLECPAASLKRLVFYLDSSIHTLDICMYIITCQDITKAIIRAQRRRVDVRIIVDAGMSENEACARNLREMSNVGVPVQIVQSPDSLMHHKFGIIDNKIMIYGSTNWTMQAFFGNFDAIIVTNQTGLIEPFINEFDRIWNDKTNSE